MTPLLDLTKTFFKGSNRLCFVYPDDKNYCIKLRRPDFCNAIVGAIFD